MNAVLKELDTDLLTNVGVLPLAQHLTRVRRKLSAQLQGLESGEVKVLILLEGGRSDEDDTRHQIQELRACLQDIDLALHAAVRIQQSTAALAWGDSSIGARRPTSLIGVRGKCVQ